MLARLATAVAYGKAPRATFVMRQLVRRPKTTTTALVLAIGLRESPTLRKLAGGLLGLAALGVTLPILAVWRLRR